MENIRTAPVKNAVEEDYKGKTGIPESYKGDKVPLVIVNHGGEHHDICTYTAWHILADGEGFLVLYPECLHENTPWNIWNLMSEVAEYPDDVAYLNSLITYISEQYFIDTERIYMTGHSMGDAMMWRMCGISCFATAGEQGDRSYLIRKDSINHCLQIKWESVSAWGGGNVICPEGS